MEVDKPQKLSLLLEHESGVMEVFLSVTRSDEKLNFRPLGSAPLSGELRSTDPEAVRNAIQLQAWSQKNAPVFEGKVVPDGM